jgi:alpha-beta hydrolase superfamily lysophospholipase
MHRYFEVNQAGHNIRCKLYYQDLKNIRKVVVFCHGFGSDKDTGSAEKLAQRLLSKYKGFALVTFNWPCHGDDVKKKLNLEDCSTYLELAVNYLQEKYQPQALFCYAVSFGGYQTLRYLSQKGSPFRRIVLRCPAVNMYDALTQVLMTPSQLEQIALGRDVSVGFDKLIPISPAFLEQLRENDVRKMDFLDWAEDLLIIQGTKDDTIPYEEVHAFAENQLIEFLPVEGADHRFRAPGTMEIVLKAISEFFTQA